MEVRSCWAAWRWCTVKHIFLTLYLLQGAFFVGKGAILAWINDTYRMNVQKIEETASGAVACQVLDSIWPGEINMAKVRWDAKSSHEFVDNYKMIQRAFEKKGVDKYIDVEKLIRGKYQVSTRLPDAASLGAVHSLPRSIALHRWPICPPPPA